MRRPVLTLALAGAIALGGSATAGGCTAPRDRDRRDAAAPLGDGERPLAEQCTPSAAGASGFDDDLDGAIDEGCSWTIGLGSALTRVHASAAALASPALSSDKQRLYAVDLVQGALVVSSRPSRDRPFDAPAASARWEGTPIAGATVAADELEVIVEVPSASLARATRASTDAPFGALEAIPLNVPPPHHHPRLSTDGTELFFVALVDGRFRVHRAVRAARGEPFEPAAVVLSGPALNELTPALTEDGRTLVVSLDGDLWRFERTSRDAPFDAGTGLGAVPAGSVGLWPFVSLATRELFYVGVTWPWSPVPTGTIFRAPICRDGACPARAIPCEGGVLGADLQHCYVPFRVPLAWDEARADCEARGAHLATIGSADEHALVASLDPGVAQWLGATDRARECNLGEVPEGCAFEWVRSVDPFVYAAWGAGEPSGADPVTAAREDCLATSELGTFEDRDCAATHGYVCESERYLSW